MKRPVLSITLAAAFLTAGCAGPLPLDDRQLGVSEGLAVVAPGFVVEASPVAVDGEVVLEVRAALQPADLAFVRRDEHFVAEVPLWFRVRDPQGRETLASREVTDSLVVSTVAETQSDEPVVYAERFGVAPGRMVAEVILRDLRGEPRATRRFETSVPPPHESLLGLRLLRNGPVIGARVPRWRLQDGLRAVVDLADHVTTGARLALVRIRADTTVATPPYWINPGRGSLVFRGAVFDGEGVDSVMIVPVARGDVALPLLEEGVYVLAASVAGQQRQEARPIIVLPEDHPRIEHVDAMIDALPYVAFTRELEAMREGLGPQDRRERFDAFWASLFDVRAIAERTMRLYYERVEEANRLFTAHKPGWMTDRGMVFVVLGAPDYVEHSLDGEIWQYPRAVASERFVFERVPYARSPWPLDHYVLQRSTRFESDWQRAIRRWRAGEMR